MHRSASSGQWPAVAVVAVACGGFLAFDPGGWQAFGPAKWTVVTVAALGGAAAAVWRGIPVHRPSAVAWIAFLGWAAVTSLTALDPLSAWLGTPDRRMGFWGLATIAGAYVAGQAVVSPRQRHVVARAAVVTLVVMGAYGLLEALGAAPIELGFESARIGGTFGSAAYLAGAVVLLLPVAAALAVTRAEPLPWRAAGAVAAIIGIGLLAGSGTRAGVVGLIAAAAVTRGVWWPPLTRRPVVALAIAAAAFALLMVTPLGQRVASLPDDPMARGRIDEWSVAARALADRPFLGTGLEGYRIVFPEVVDVAYAQVYGRTTFTDRAHSGPLDLGVAMGVAGVVAWLAAAVWLSSRAIGVVSASEPVATGLAAGLVGFFAQQLLLFPTLELDVGAWAIAGVVVAASARGPRLHLRNRIAAVLLSGLAVTALLAGGADIGADRAAGRGLTQESIAAADRAASLRGDSFRYHLVAAEVARRQGDFEGSLTRIERALGLTPRDPALRLARGRVMTDQALTGQDGVSDAIAVLEDLVASDPTHPEVRLLLGRLLATDGRIGEAERAWLAAEFLAPNDATVPLELARVYIALGRREAALDAIARAELIEPASPGLAELRRLAEEA
ncbi:hypothetical protein BH23ACT5_BH23ACT5_23060 [soil metagenome]